VGGLAALGVQIAVDPSSTVPTLGASGAIAAVLGGYILLYPRARRASRSSPTSAVSCSDWRW
jgi:membrane associated rhomboid family serine protease